MNFSKELERWQREVLEHFVVLPEDLLELGEMCLDLRVDPMAVQQLVHLAIEVAVQHVLNTLIVVAQVLLGSSSPPLTLKMYRMMRMIFSLPWSWRILMMLSTNSFWRFSKYCRVKGLKDMIHTQVRRL